MHSGGLSETNCTTLWGRKRLSFQSWDDDAHGGVYCTANVHLGSHEKPDDLSETAMARIISFLVISYMGNDAVKEAASSLIDMQQHYRAIEKASSVKSQALPQRLKVGHVHEPREAKAFEVE